MPVKNLIGMKFGRLTVVEFAGLKKYGLKNKSLWKCYCDCEKKSEIIIVGTYLSTSETKSCGCISLPSVNENIKILKQRILNSIKKNEDNCWLWQGYLCEPKKLYGLTSSNLDGKKKKILSHRLSYRLFKGEIPNGMYVLHSCDVPLCCNPEHLHLGTAQDNINEMKERGRERKALGEKNRHAKLNDNIVLEIRKLYRNGLTQAQIMEKFNLPSSTTSYIVNNKTWRHI